MVTGGSRGIGRAIVERLAAAGATVLTCSRRRDARAVHLPDTVGWRRCDVADSAEVEALREYVEKNFGAATILVNNAGVQVEKTVTDSDDADWDAVVGANCRGVFNCCRAFIPGMEAAGGGAIVNIGSISGVVADRAWRSTMHRKRSCTADPLDRDRSWPNSALQCDPAWLDHDRHG
ncbi:MAG: SDR family oxidoreductase [Alphaproteobacteria bacterium]